MLENYETTPNKEIMKVLGRTKNSVEARAKKLKLRKQSADHDYFKTWNSNMAYILGLIFADGTVSRDTNQVSITLHKDDVDLLKSVKYELKTNCKILDVGTSDCYRLPFFSSTIKEDLISLGVVPNKSLVVEMPDVPTEFLSDFVRGYFDGDGSLVQSNENPRVHITCGSKVFLEQLGEEVFKETSIPSSINNHGNVFRLYFNGLNALDFASWLYSNNPELLLNRKHERYLEYEEKYRDKYMKRVEAIKDGTYSIKSRFAKSTQRYYK